MDEAGFPEGVFINAAVSGAQCGRLLEHPKVRGVALTGSTPVGKDLGAQAGRLLKRAVLELGGADSYVVLEDADVEAAAAACKAGRVLNCGQSCIGAKRFVVTEVPLPPCARVRVRGPSVATTALRLRKRRPWSAPGRTRGTGTGG